MADKDFTISLMKESLENHGFNDDLLKVLLDEYINIEKELEKFPVLDDFNRDEIIDNWADEMYDTYFEDVAETDREETVEWEAYKVCASER